MTAQTAWALVSVSFVMALGGAVVPGPLFTYTVARTVKTPARGFLTGPLTILGHAALELVVLCGLVLGVIEFLKEPAVIKAIGVAGALLLGYMGIGLLREVFRARASARAVARTAAVQDGSRVSEAAAVSGGFAPQPASPAPKAPEGAPASSLMSRLHPVLAGVLMSMSNPWWWVWWITVGPATLMRFGVSSSAWQGVLLFFIGHELGDLGWYSLVSLLAHFGRRILTGWLYNAILALCGLAIISFAVYLGVSPFLGNG